MDATTEHTTEGEEAAISARPVCGGAQNPKAILDEYGLSAVAPGTSQGYKINSAHPALANSGLQPGDRVVSVNGAPLGVAMNDVRLIDQARSAGRVRVEVERGGRRFFLTIPIP